MGLRDRLHKQSATSGQETSGNILFNAFGVTENPFPSASQTQGHPHMETEADDTIAAYVIAYDKTRATQVLVIEGDQGAGKTNLLNYYEAQFKDLYPEGEGYYIIRYYANPEPGFDKMLTRIFEELGTAFLATLAGALNNCTPDRREEIINLAKLSDMRIVLRGLCKKAASNSASDIEEASEAALSWILGSRLLNRHRDVLGSIHFRLDTVESKTQALRDLVFCSAELGVLKALILLLDELEKTDDTASKLTILRFLSAIRALIDALPKHLFLMAAMTPEARRRYFAMLPAFAGRLQNRIELPYLKQFESAWKLTNFYITEAKRKATLELGAQNPATLQPILTEIETKSIFTELLQNSQKRGDEGIRQRDYLNSLRAAVEQKFKTVSSP